jgi:hypothetical protein
MIIDIPFDDPGDSLAPFTLMLINDLLDGMPDLPMNTRFIIELLEAEVERRQEELNSLENDLSRVDVLNEYLDRLLAEHVVQDLS